MQGLEDPSTGSEEATAALVVERERVGKLAEKVASLRARLDMARASAPKKEQTLGSLHQHFTVFHVEKPDAEAAVWEKSEKIGVLKKENEEALYELRLKVTVAEAECLSVERRLGWLAGAKEQTESLTARLRAATRDLEEVRPQSRLFDEHVVAL